MRHPVAGLHHSGCEPESHAVHKPFRFSPCPRPRPPPGSYTARIEPTGAGRDQAGDGPQGIMAVEAHQFGEVVARAERHDAQRGVGLAAQEPVRDLVHRAVAAHRDDVLGALPGGLRRQLLRVTGAFGADDIDRPPLRPERPRDCRLDAACRASSGRGVEDDMGMKHAADKISSRLPRKGPVDYWLCLVGEIVLVPIDCEFDTAPAAHQAAGLAP